MDSFSYTIWFAFTILEAFGIAFIRKPEHRMIRAFLIFRLLSDFIKLAIIHEPQLHWDISWTAKEIELVWLALIAGNIVLPGRAWRLPAFTVSVLAFHHLWTQGWPYYATPEQMFLFERTACFMILGTLIIGAYWLLQEDRLTLAAAIVLMVSADMVYALTFQMGDYSPKVGGCIWVASLGILVAALKVRPQHLLKPLVQTFSSESQSPDISSEMCIRLPLTPKPRFWS